MQIRNAELKDLSKCVELLHLPEFVFSDGDYPDLEYLKIYFGAGLFFVAEENSEIIGCIFGEKMRGKIAMLWYFVVDKDQRSKGVGQKMISHFENECKKQNVEWITLYSPATSLKSLKFYEKMGYNKGKAHVEFDKQLE